MRRGGGREKSKSPLVGKRRPRRPRADRQTALPNGLTSLAEAGAAAAAAAAAPPPPPAFSQAPMRGSREPPSKRASRQACEARAARAYFWGGEGGGEYKGIRRRRRRPRVADSGIEWGGKEMGREKEAENRVRKGTRGKKEATTAPCPSRLERARKASSKLKKGTNKAQAPAPLAPARRPRPLALGPVAQ